MFPTREMPATWDYVRDLAVRAEQIGFDLTLIAELNLNDIKRKDAPSLDAWSTAAAIAAVTKTQELMVAVRPNFHQPGLFARPPRTSTASSMAAVAQRRLVVVG